MRLYPSTYAWVLAVAIGAAACSGQPESQSADRLLARVHNKSLYLSELEGMFPQFATHEDSLLVIRAFTDRWVREAVLLHEAEKNLPADFNIDKLVRDYRASLIRSHYERALVEQLLDSTVSQQELKAFYEQHQEQYQLETPIIRCRLLKIQLPVANEDRLRKLWDSNRDSDARQLKEYAEKHAEVALLDESLWYSIDEISRLLPKGTMTSENISSKQEFTLQDGEYQYYFRFFERKNRQDIAPLSYIQEQARKVILHMRKQQLLEDVKRDMYDQELRRNNIEILID
jgi:hypothetical protein